MASQTSANQPLGNTQSLDLWQKALGSLDNELRAGLDFARCSKYDILRKTLQTAEEKKQLA